MTYVYPPRERSTTHSHDATYMVLDARECVQRRDIDSYPPSQLGRMARPPQHYAPPPHDTATTALATTPRESPTTHSHGATYMALDARGCVQRRNIDAHPPSQLGGSARPPQHYAPPPHDTATTALATTPRESSTTHSHDATYMALDARECIRICLVSKYPVRVRSRLRCRRGPLIKPR